MRLLVDGKEIPWPREIVVEVDGFEEVGPLLVRIVGGVLHLMAPGHQGVLTIQGEMTTNTDYLAVRSPLTSLLLGGGSYNKMQRDAFLSDARPFVASGSAVLGGAAP